MFRVNSMSKQLVRLDIVEAGSLHQVALLPKNFVFTDVVTDQLKVLEREGVIKVKEVKVINASDKKDVKPVVENSDDGKLDFVNDSKIAKVQKKKK